MSEIKLGVYRHYKGNIYRVLHIAKHSETLEDMVVYQDVNCPDKLWVRPAFMWNDDVIVKDKLVKRFQFLKNDDLR